MLRTFKMTLVSILKPLLNYWTQINYLLICFALFYQLVLVLQLNFVSDSIVLIFSQSTVNIMIDTKCIQLSLCIFQIKQNK